MVSAEVSFRTDKESEVTTHRTHHQMVHTTGTTLGKIFLVKKQWLLQCTQVSHRYVRPKLYSIGSTLQSLTRSEPWQVGTNSWKCPQQPVEPSNLGTLELYPEDDFPPLESGNLEKLATL